MSVEKEQPNKFIAYVLTRNKNLTIVIFQEFLIIIGPCSNRQFSNTNFLSKDAKDKMLNSLSSKIKTIDSQYKNLYSEYGRRINMLTGDVNGTDYITDYSKPFGEQMIKTIILSVIIVLISIVFLIIMPKPQGVTYDCRLAEISPDYPIEVKNECRKRMSK